MFYPSRKRCAGINQRTQELQANQTIRFNVQRSNKTRMAITNELDDMLAMSKCLKKGIKIEAVPQEQGRYGKCKLQVTRNGDTVLGDRLYSQKKEKGKQSELNEQILLMYRHYANQIK
jgi:putative hemolysin